MRVLYIIQQKYKRRFLLAAGSSENILHFCIRVRRRIRDHALMLPRLA